MGYCWKNYGIYWAKTIGYFMAYIRQKLWDIIGKNYEIYYVIYWLKIVGKTMGYTGQMDILNRKYRIY